MDTLENCIEKEVYDFETEFGMIFQPYGDNLHKAKVFLRSFATKIAEATRIETAKAYGRCEKCYGKGYATRNYAVVASDDFSQEGRVIEPYKTHMIFCSCDRGKQLKKYTKEIAESQREEDATIAEKDMETLTGNAMYDEASGRQERNTVRALISSAIRNQNV